MQFPESSRIELPILLELQATGGSEQLRYLYPRLVDYFPQLDRYDLSHQNADSKWRRLVQRAGRELAIRGEIERNGTFWYLTTRGRKHAEQESLQPSETKSTISPLEINKVLSHREAQDLLANIGRMLGKHAEIEYEYYDVIWRDSPVAPRISHVFEVQIKGNLYSALAKLKHNYDTQRSKPFLIIAGERDSAKAREALLPLLSGSFHEIGPDTVVLGTGDLQRLYQTLQSASSILKELF